MFKKILNNKTATIASAAVILGAASLVSRLVGLLRDRILFSMFGAGAELDIYYAAFRIPDFIDAFLILGVLSAGFIPVFIDYLNKDKDNAWHLANSVLNLIILILAAVCLILFFTLPFLIRWVAPGFSAANLAMSVKLSRIMLLSALLMAVSAVFGDILQSYRRFFVYSLAPILYNLGIIFGALVLTRFFGLAGLAYGVVCGALLHLAIHIPTAVFCGFRWRPVFDFKFEGVKRIFKLVLPRLGSLFFNQITLWVFTALASFLAAGSIAIYNVSYNIFSFPLGIFAISFAMAAFPSLSEYSQKKDKAGFVKTFSAASRQMLFFILPASVLFIVLRFQIVRVVLGAGRFGWQDTILTARTLAFFSVGLFVEGLIYLFLRGFFAWEDTLTPCYISFFANLGRIANGWIFARYFGVAGLALGFSLGNVVYLLLLFILLRKKIGTLDEKNVFIAAGKMLTASLISAAAVYFSLRHLLNFISLTSAINVFIQGLIAGLIGIFVYFLFAWIFRVQELKIFFRSLSRRLTWKKVSVTEIRE